MQWIKFRSQSVVGIDNGKVHLVEDARKHGSLEFSEPEYFWIRRDVARRREDVLRIFELNEAGMTKEQQSTGAVRRIVGNCDRRSFGQGRECFPFRGVGADWSDE